ncbi:PREDICTED: oleosin [Prunus dulcis]|uniref:PREDICTED: oleosin n=1 Tax=Prunus dulcis TaxID=3755 RepID=A0A5E4ET40_PRUDU|nr:oleosin S1-2 [Prunus dulcis]VVA18843.1 PREDICTED: oleosin [Prunus dulcis]
MEVHGKQQASGTKVVLAAMGGLAIGGSLVFLMGLSFLASVTLLVLSSPLLLIFSPLLFFAGFVFVGAAVGFAVAGAMALTGMSTLGWIFEELGGTSLLGFGGGLTERLKEQGKDWAGLLQHGNEQDIKIASRGQNLLVV